MTVPDDPLSLDIRRDLDRVDGVMTRVITDSATAEEFIRDPSGVLTRLGLHPRTTREIHERANRIFYAVLTNTELMEVILDHYASFSGPALEANRAVLNQALERGEIRNTIELDVAAAEHAFQAPDFLRRIYRLTLYDLNNRRLLQNTYSTEQIDDYVDRMVEAIRQRRAIREQPTLEEWDDHYGVDTGYGVSRENEIAVPVTAGALVEVAAAVTVVIPVAILGVEESVMVRAVRGDPRAGLAVATVGAALRLAGEVLVHATNFERA
jgi:hypothetical protein